MVKRVGHFSNKIVREDESANVSKTKLELTYIEKNSTN
jgi:hypothetical protein